MANQQRKWALITGASPGGMGEAEAAAFLKRGVNVIATSIDTDDIEYLQPEKDRNDGFLVTLRLDVTSTKSIDAAVKQVENLTDGKLDFLINNAGYGYFGPLMDVDISQAKKQFDVNVWGVLAVTQAFFPLLRAAKGTIVNQASISGVEGFSRPFMGIYSSSKAAVMNMSAVMRVELAPFDIHVVTLVTSAVKTEFYANRTGGGILETSAYFPIKEELEGMMGRSLADGRGHERERVAESTVEELLRTPPPLFVRKGYAANVLAWLMWLLPTWVLDAQSVSGTPVGRLQNVLRGNADTKKSD
ncbi:hypothetical protein M409DRAFT_52428 [Zasmidium cellare ATCC 36951]|uniref:NAD(P)-binding protein n=1 Tax=Zasmidium cellare ATCC 36951 TaxID=1080233 RepID=A0A6A6CTI5_ZASCE|nr:uncharacterized protein M409DRAFT_52428 [Zasmidium cellare ATCC 36951]KAF2169142.1 hypothetical protein M409DRAFT_52428 [Zasmidium cellare ATCC 36951]